MPSATQIEVRPLGMSSGWANRYFMQPLESERSIHWWGCEDAKIFHPKILFLIDHLTFRRPMYIYIRYGIDVHQPSSSKPSLWEEQRSAVLNKQVWTANSSHTGIYVLFRNLLIFLSRPHQTLPSLMDRSEPGSAMCRCLGQH